MPTPIYCCAICSKSQEIPLGEAAFLDKLEQDFKDVYPDMKSPVKDGYAATLRKLFEENLKGNNKNMRTLFLVIYYGFAQHLPGSYSIWGDCLKTHSSQNVS